MDGYGADGRVRENEKTIGKLKMEELVLVGFGGHAKSIVDSIEAAGIYHIAGYTDPKSRCEYHGYKCLGTDDDLAWLFQNGIRKAVVSVGYLGKGNLRNRLYEKLKQVGYQLPAIIDPSAVIGKDVKIGEGTYIGKRAVLNAGTQIGKMSIINTGAIVEHESKVGEFTHIAVGSVLCGSVSVGRKCLIGAGAVVIQEIEIEDEAVIGAGSVILGHIKRAETVYGIVKGTGL